MTTAQAVQATTSWPTHRDIVAASAAKAIVILLFSSPSPPLTEQGHQAPKLLVTIEPSYIATGVWSRTPNELPNGGEDQVSNKQTNSLVRCNLIKRICVMVTTAHRPVMSFDCVSEAKCCFPNFDCHPPSISYEMPTNRLSQWRSA